MKDVKMEKHIGAALRIVVGVMAAASPLLAPAQVKIEAAPPRSGPLGGLFAPMPPPQPADPKTFPRTADDKPDFTGIWSSNFGGPKPTPAPLTAAYQAKVQDWDRATKAGLPYATSESRCIGVGMPHMMGMLNLEFIQTPKQITIILEEMHEVRRIYLDGRSRPGNWDPSFDGYSVGHWEGDTLVVDTSALRDSDGSNDWLGPNAQIVERISMINSNAIKDDFTVADPDRLTDVWKFERLLTRAKPGKEMEEVVCENNRNLPDANGIQTAQ